MGCGDEKLSKYLTQTFIAHCNAMICQQVTLSGDAEWPKVADAVIEAEELTEKLTQHTWTLCACFEYQKLLLANDSFSEDGAQEYAVYHEGREIESLTVSWMTHERLQE